MDQFGSSSNLQLIGVAIGVAVAILLFLYWRSQVPQSSLKKPFISGKSSDSEECVEKVEPKAPANRTPSSGADASGTPLIRADVEAAVLDAKLVSPSRELWYVERLADILKEHGTFKILRMSSGALLKANISSETSPDGLRRSLEIFNGKSLISRVCTSMKTVHKNGQQDETVALRLSILDAKYKHLGQLRLVTPTHFEFLCNAEIIAILDIDDAGQLDISTASGNRMACVSYGCEHASGNRMDMCISVSAGIDTGLTISLVLAAIILRGGADRS